MIIEPFSATLPKIELIPYPETFFDEIKYLFSHYLEIGFFKTIKKKNLYIYSIQASKRTIYGFVSKVAISEFYKQNVLEHENTKPEGERNMMYLTLEQKAIVKPVLLGFQDNGTFKKLAKKAAARKPKFKVYLESAKEIHCFWKLKKSEQKRLIRFAKNKIDKAYIADGHHRTSAFKLLAQNPFKNQNLNMDGILSTFIPLEYLTIHDFNRVYQILDDISPTRFMTKLSKYLNIKLLNFPSKPKKKFSMTMFLDNKWYLLSWKKKILARYENFNLLDSEFLNKLIVMKIMKIKNPRTDQRILFLSGETGLLTLINKVNKNPYRVGFCLFPVSKKDFIRKAKRREMLPAKSTWFEPRLKNGMIANILTKTTT